MPSSYLNLTSPIKRETNTYVDQEGVQFSSMLITATAACAPALVPAIGSVYELNSNLWVTQSDLTYSSDGLGKITVTAQGPSTTAKPRVRIIPNAPRIFGLSPGLPSNGPYPPYSASAGVTVEVTFIDLESNLLNIISTYSKKLMPASIKGQSLPVQASPPKVLDLPPISRGDGTTYLPAVGYYAGFCCIGMRTEQRGRAIVVVLTFQEAGYMSVPVFGQDTISYPLGNLFAYNWPL